jgi:hypothetical protein
VLSEICCIVMYDVIIDEVPLLNDYWHTEHVSRRCGVTFFKNVEVVSLDGLIIRTTDVRVRSPRTPKFVPLSETPRPATAPTNIYRI